MAYAKTLNQMWNMDSSVVTPDMFKRVLGQYANQFQGYGQHDSHECINTVLDFLGEDLYRKGKKPYIDMDEDETLSQEDRARDSWNRHLYRNESIITDLFHGQFKSTVSCSKCPRVSTTFDPMMTMLLPIPGKKELVKFFYLPYDVKENYMNANAEITVRSSDTWAEFRQEFKEKYGIGEGEYTITKVSDNNFKQYYNTNSLIDSYVQKSALGKVDGVLLLYEVDPRLKKQMPENPDPTDSNNGVSAEFTRLALNMSYLQRGRGFNNLEKDTTLPRLMWINKSWNLKQLHLEVFSYLRQVFSQWIDYNDPSSELSAKQPDLSK